MKSVPAAAEAAPLLPAPADRERGRTARVLLLIVLAALAVRLVVATRSVMLSRDAVGFIEHAQALAADPLGTLRTEEQHPLYPALAWAAHAAIEHTPGMPEGLRQDPVRSWTLAVLGVSMIGGLGVVLAAYALAAQLFDRRAGLIAAALAAGAAEFCQLSADGLTDMPHLALFLLAVAAAVWALRSGRLVGLIGVGLLSGVAFLTRPEGAEPAVVTAALLLVAPRTWRWPKRAGGVACIVVSAAVVVSPYMWITGKLVPKKPITQFVLAPRSLRPLRFNELSFFPAAGATATDDDSPRRARSGKDRETELVGHDPPYMVAGMVAIEAPAVVRAWGAISENYARSLRVTLLLPAIWWVIRRKHYPGDPLGCRLILGAVVLHLVLLVRLIVGFDYEGLFSLRHVMVLAGLTLPFSAAGVADMLQLAPPTRRLLTGALLFIGMIAPTAPWMFEQRFADDAHYLQAAAYIRDHTAGTPRVMTDRFRIALYARGPRIDAPYSTDPRAFLKAARRVHPQWLVFDRERIARHAPDFFTGLEALPRPGETLILEHTVTQPTRRGDRHVLIYRYNSAPSH